jgi:CHRD domain-containing protein
MRSIVRVGSVAVAGLAIALTGAVSADHDHGKREEVVRAHLVGVNEVPSVSSPATATFRAVIDEEGGTISYTLKYEGFLNTVTQSHFHFGQHHTSGGISVFICTNLGNSPGSPACPAAQGEISGVATAASVIGPAGQGISPGEFAELLAAIRAGSVYVNIHSNIFPAGEIRGQLVGGHRD